MTAATPIVGVNAVVKWTPTGGSLTVLKNMSWTINHAPDVKRTSNTTDGIVRVTGLLDYTGSVEGALDMTAPIEANVVSGQTGVLQLYRTASAHYYSLNAIITGISDNTGTETEEKWAFQFALWNGTLTLPT